MDVKAALKISKAQKAENVKLVRNLKRLKPKGLDESTHEAHDEVFEKIDCLTCANCCKTTSPGMTERDVAKLAKHFRVKPSKLVDQYMHRDEDGEYVFKGAPCPFLAADNYCSVYDSRPLACREYPHTNRKKFYQVLDLSLKNTEVCPAVVQVFEKIKLQYQKKPSK